MIAIVGAGTGAGAGVGTGCAGKDWYRGGALGSALGACGGGTDGSPWGAGEGCTGTWGTGALGTVLQVEDPVVSKTLIRMHQR